MGRGRIGRKIVFIESEIVALIGTAPGLRLADLEAGACANDSANEVGSE